MSRDNSSNFRRNSGRSQRSKRVMHDHERVNNSVYKSSGDESLVRATLAAVLDGLGGLEKDSRGLMDLTEVAAAIAENNDALSFVTYVHLIELYLKDSDEFIRLEGTSIGKKNDDFIEPPEFLYFGTTDKYFDKMVTNGIHSGTKPFIRLYSDEEDALRFAKQFLRPGQPDTELCALQVEAKEAYDKGIKFSSSEKRGEFLTASISPNYINEEL